jgi:protein Tex
VAAFGAFVDIGVHQEGLVHVSAMSRNFVSDPREVAKSGDIVKVKVLSVDIPRKRISLSMRLDDEPAGGPGGKPDSAPRQGGKPQNSNTGRTQPARASQGRPADDGGGAMAAALRRAGLASPGGPAGPAGQNRKGR